MHVPRLHTETWAMFLLPSALTTVAAAIARRSYWADGAVFTVASSGTTAVASAIRVYLLGQMDPKFYGSPDAAFEISLLAGAIFCALTAVIYLVSRIVLQRRFPQCTPRTSVVLPFLTGLSTALGPDVLGISTQSTLIGWMILAPVTGAATHYVSARKRLQVNQRTCSGL